MISPMINDFREYFVMSAQTQIGVRELKPNTSPEINSYSLAVDGKIVIAPWCMAFVQWAALESCKSVCHSPMESERVKEGMYTTRSVVDFWNHTPQEKKITLDAIKFNSLDSFRGCVFFMQSIQDPSHGHCGIVEEKKSTFIFETIEGNTDASGGRDGDGVYSRLRDFSTLHTFNFLGFVDVPKILYESFLNLQKGT